ncbi:MAG: YggS family pyridoxal phosphate-dependent enzyme [Vampirovibrionales bacterium]|nr:YggS family pyridoxal phosphate-dependent enzyme [Vampirovibrionales bacterium]
MPSPEYICHRVQSVQEELAHAPQRVTLVAVTKTHPASVVKTVYDAGIFDVGENKVQEALEKQTQLESSCPNLRWHLIGPLQTNKVNKTVGKFELIHSVDRLEVAQKLNDANAAAGLVQRVLLQVNISGEASKGGFSNESLNARFAQLVALPAIRIEGLMTMAPFDADEATLQVVFMGLVDFRDYLVSTHGHPLPQLSMGMSDDYATAIACGSTMVRLGRTLFGER